MSGRGAGTGNIDSAIAGVVIGIAFIAVVFIVLAIQHRQRMDLVETFTSSSSGIVERVDSYRARRNKRSITVYKYFVSFKDSDGIPHEGESMARSEKKPIHSEGDAVTVRYDPMKADEACVIEGNEYLV